MKAELLRSALEQRFPIANYVTPADSYYRLEQIYILFCGLMENVKIKKVLNTVAQHLNEGKNMGRALADTMEQFNDKDGTNAEK